MTDDRRPTFHMARFTSYVTRRASLVTGATLLVAFFLRAYRLADQNVWWDEGWSVWLSQKDVAWIALRTAMDEHPPLHYWMLHFWNFVAGTSAFSGRFVSLAFGVLTVALIYRIGKRIGGVWIGALAALFLATARFHIWWSQDIKNYTPSIFFAFAAVWFAIQILDFRFQISDLPVRHSPLAPRNSLLAYALCAALALWTHYLAALVLLALNAYALIIFIADKPKIENHKSKILNWFVANALAAALFAPWLYLYLQNAAEWTAAPAFDFALFLKLVATVLPLGVTTNIDDYAALTLALTTLAILGCSWIIPSRFTFHVSRFTSHASLFALVVVLPPFLIYLLSLTPAAFFAPKIQARYLLILLPAYVILLALGIKFLSRLSRPFALFALLFVLGVNAFVLNDYYAARRLRDEYTTLANTINAFARAGDVVLLHTDQEWPTFLYHLRARLDWLGAPNGKAMTPDDADALVRRALTRHDAVWLVTIPDALATDPQKLLEARLARELPKRLEQTFDDKRLVLYAREERDLIHVARENFAPQIARTQSVNEDVILLGYDVPVREVRGGDTVRVATYWNARVAQPALPIPLPAGERVRVQTDLFVPPDARAFSVNINGIELARLAVEPRAARARVGEIANRVDYRLGDAIHLVGYDLSAANLKPNDTLNLKLYWRAERPIEKSYTVFAQIVGEFNPRKNNPLWGQVDRAPAPPTNAWLPNEIVAETYRIVIDADAPAGAYTLIVGMYDAATGARLLVEEGGDYIALARIQVQK
jgi:4-amino-4-deoxy-L-arabinose transferase-like glycosyltransferase